MHYPVQMIRVIKVSCLRKDLDFVSCSRFPLADAKSMRGMNKFGNIRLSLAASMLCCIRSGTSARKWLFRKSLLPRMELRSDRWAFSNEFKLEAYYAGADKFGEFVIPYDDRVGPTHNITVWKTGVQVLGFMFTTNGCHFARARITDPRAHANDPPPFQPPRSQVGS